MSYISIKDACERYSVSESKIRRIIKDLKVNDLSKLQFEKLNNGNEKILIEIGYLDRLMNKSKTTSNKGSHEGIQDNNNELVNYLKEQLQEKDKQINQLHVLLSQAQQLQLESPKKKKRWWQRGRN